MNWLRKVLNWIRSRFHQDLPDEMYAVRTDDLINPRPTSVKFHFEPGPNFNEISVVPGTDLYGEYFTPETTFDMSLALRKPSVRFQFDNSNWMKSQIKSLEDKGLV